MNTKDTPMEGNSTCLVVRARLSSEFYFEVARQSKHILSLLGASVSSSVSTFFKEVT